MPFKCAAHARCVYFGIVYSALIIHVTSPLRSGICRDCINAHYENFAIRCLISLKPLICGMISVQHMSSRTSMNYLATFKFTHKDFKSNVFNVLHKICDLFRKMLLKGRFSSG